MENKLFCILRICILLLCSHTVLGQGEGLQVVLTTENDFLGFGNRDDNYTGAAKVEFLFPEQFEWLPFFKFRDTNSALTIQRAGIGGTAYTPQDLLATEPVIGDRPYASLMFVNIGNTSYSMSSAMLLQSDLIIGAIGTSLPGNAQSYIHEHRWFGTDRPIPMGWDNQIAFDGSFVLNYNLRAEKDMFMGLSSGSDSHWLQVRGTGAVELGNYMANLRLGTKINLLNLNPGVMQDYVAGIPTMTDDSTAPKKFRFSFFAMPEVRFVGYNATLEGLIFNDNSVYKIEHRDVNRVLVDIAIGINVLIYDRLYLKYTVYGRSQEFKGGKEFHSWGGISIGYSPAKWNSKDND